MSLFLLPVAATDENAYAYTRTPDFERKKKICFRDLESEVPQEV